MKKLTNYLNELESLFPLNIATTSFCLSMSNSGRRGSAKEFYLTSGSLEASLKDISDNLESFPANYNESIWRDSAEKFFSDNHAKSLCGVQTRPFFETINKVISWANDFQYREGVIQLSNESIDKALLEIKVCCNQKILKYPLVDDSFLNGLNEDQIIDSLAEKLKEARETPRGTQYYGFKYSQILDRFEKRVIDRIIAKTGISGKLYSEIDKGRGVFKRAVQEGELAESFYQNNGIVYPDIQVQYADFDEDDDIENDMSTYQKIFTPSQIIYYGVPGCGKSYEVNKVINAELDKNGVTDKEYHKVRCVFHPEYSNADFVGQIYPYVKPDNGGVEYRFKPGPFAEIVRRAYRNPTEPFFLIIEEINRGNAAAIFGEMFQLLDRIRPEDGPEELSGNIYNPGWSSYGVTNIDVNAYVRQKSTDNPEKIEYDDCVPYGDEIKFINNTAVRLPPNLSIYATMNTNDQNVFTMDNAFQRRFKSKMIRNVLDENSAQYKTEIDDTGVYWGKFREWINEKILLPQTAVLKADDKCLGGWFITGEKVNNVDKIKKEEFAEKVLKYLWDDVFKRNKSGEIFIKDDKVNSLSNLINTFETSVGFESFEKIFKLNDIDKAKLQKQPNS